MEEFRTSLHMLKKDILFMEKNHEEKVNSIKKNSQLSKEDLDVYMSFKKNSKNFNHISNEENQIDSLKLTNFNNNLNKSKFENEIFENKFYLNQTTKLPYSSYSNNFNDLNNNNNNNNNNNAYKSNNTTNFLEENFNLNLKENLGNGQRNKNDIIK